MKVILITQARYGSSRLPGKVLMRVGSGTKTLLDIHLTRIQQCKSIDKFILATTVEPESIEISRIGKLYGFDVFHGSVSDVLDRFYQVAKDYDCTYIVRVTSDCPFADAALIDQIVEFTISGNYLYCITSGDFPDGVDIEVFSCILLKEAWKNATLLSDREHVTPYIRRVAKERGGYMEYPSPAPMKHIRITVDEASDLDAVKHLINKSGAIKPWQVYADYIKENPDQFFNQHTQRNEGYLKSIKQDEK